MLCSFFSLWSLQIHWLQFAYTQQAKKLFWSIKSLSCDAFLFLKSGVCVHIRTLWIAAANKLNAYSNLCMQIANQKRCTWIWFLFWCAERIFERLDCLRAREKITCRDANRAMARAIVFIQDQWFWTTLVGKSNSNECKFFVIFKQNISQLWTDLLCTQHFFFGMWNINNESYGVQNAATYKRFLMEFTFIVFVVFAFKLKYRSFHVMEMCSGVMCGLKSIGLAL